MEPKMFLISSCPHDPASFDCPCAQFRKDCWHLQKSSSGRWLRRSQRFFRNWAPGSSKQSGTYEHDTGRNLEGSFRPSAHGTGYENLSKGIFFDKVSDVSLAAQGSQGAVRVIGFSAEKNWGVHAGQEFAPTHVWQPLMIYLGRPT